MLEKKIKNGDFLCRNVSGDLLGRDMVTDLLVIFG